MSVTSRLACNGMQSLYLLQNSPVSILAGLTLSIDLFHAEDLDDRLGVGRWVVTKGLLAETRSERT